jgi:hypothetical protein
MVVSRVIGLLFVSSFAMTGCLLHQTGRLYEMNDGRASALVVEHPVASEGSIHGTLPSGAECDGSFSSLSVAEAKEITGETVPFSDNAGAGVAILKCTPDVVLRCGLARRPGSGFSYGACKDQRGGEYSLMF